MNIFTFIILTKTSAVKVLSCGNGIRADKKRRELFDKFFYWVFNLAYLILKKNTFILKNIVF